MNRKNKDFENKRILLVEDYVINQEITLEMLQMLGFEADLAPDGETAMKMLKKKKYDGIILDVKLKKMDGYTVAQKIRSSESAGERIPIIALTANALLGDREKCLAAGMDDYLSKPIEIDGLEEMLSKFFARG